MRSIRIALIAIVTLAADAALAAVVEIPGGQDHQLVKRFAGSVLVGTHTADWESVELPTSAQTLNRKLVDPITLEGKLAQLVYIGPQGKAPLEVYRNFEEALNTAGFKKKFSCESNCAELWYAWSAGFKWSSDFHWSKQGAVPSADGNGTFPYYGALNPDQGRMLYGTLTRAGLDTHVLVYTSTAAFAKTERTAIFLEVVEPKAMQLGQVAIDANKLQAGLADEGKISLYGIFFDTGKATLKPESKAQLDEMAKLLQTQSSLKVYIVGHTDNQGSLTSNQTLSQQRAQAVVTALIAEPYKIDPKRLGAYGVASLSPVASNSGDAGRAKNRRVEMVVQ